MTLKFNRSGCEAITAAKVQLNQYLIYAYHDLIDVK